MVDRGWHRNPATVQLSEYVVIEQTQPQWWNKCSGQREETDWQYAEGDLGGKLNECSLGGQKRITEAHALVRTDLTAVNICAFHYKFHLNQSILKHY